MCLYTFTFDKLIRVDPSTLGESLQIFPRASTHADTRGPQVYTSAFQRRRCGLLILHTHAHSCILSLYVTVSV